MNTISNQILSDITVHTKYARHLREEARRETWEELARRNCEMHVSKYPDMEHEITDVYEKFVIPKLVLPSMRSMQFAGRAILRNPARIYNCSYLPIDHIDSFSELMFLLLSGTGVGYSVQYRHVNRLPRVIGPRNLDQPRRYVIGDSIEGWADAVKVLIEAYFLGKDRVKFDFDDIRVKGTELVVSGGKAPGPEPLRICLIHIAAILNSAVGRRLTPIECHDILCFIADAVLAGGIRRAAMIALFSAEDIDMMTCKSGAWYELNPQRGRANNSVVLHRQTTSREEYTEVFDRIQASGAGEPGIFWTNDYNWGANPCCEIALRPYQFCNLTELNVSNVTSQEDLNARARAAAFIGTLQAGYTDFHYLRPIWKRTTEREALIGVGQTGIASGVVLGLDLKQAAQEVNKENERVANLIGIKRAARTTTVKPSGTTSLVLGTSSGIHAWHSPFYIRRIRLGKDESIAQYLIKELPELVEDDYFSPGQVVVSIPQEAPQGSIMRSETCLELFDRVVKFNQEWVREGHRAGKNFNNVSATLSVRQEEWDELRQYMWEDRGLYTGMAILPYDGGSYKQAPFEEITKKRFKELEKHLHNIDLTKVIELTDDYDRKGELACAGGVCEIL